MTSGRRSFVRVPVFFQPTVLERIDALVVEVGSNRSMVVRDAVERALPHTIREFRRQYKARLKHVGVRSGSEAPTALDPAAPVPLDAAVAKLVPFAQAVRIGGETPTPDVLRDVVELHARTLGIDPDDFDDAVAEALGRVLSPDEDPSSVPLRRDPNRPPD